MGRNGDITMDNLKAATTIGKDELSEHHPSGAGNNTRFGHFLVEDVGGNLNPSQDSSIDGLYLKVKEVTLSDGSQISDGSGSYDAANKWEFGQQIDLTTGYLVYLEVYYEISSAPNFSDKDGIHAREQIFHPFSRWDGVITRRCQINSISLLDEGSNYLRSEVEVEVTDDGGDVGCYFGWSPDLNTDMPNANKSLGFSTDEVQGNSGAYNVSIDSFTPDCENNESWDMEVEVSVGGGVPDYDLYLNHTSGRVDSKTVSSDGTYYLYDPDVDLTSEQTYQLEVTDAQGNTEITDRTWKFLCQ